MALIWIAANVMASTLKCIWADVWKSLRSDFDCFLMLRKNRRVSFCCSFVGSSDQSAYISADLSCVSHAVERDESLPELQNKKPTKESQ